MEDETLNVVEARNPTLKLVQSPHALDALVIHASGRFGSSPEKTAVEPTSITLLKYCSRGKLTREIPSITSTVEVPRS